MVDADGGNPSPSPMPRCECFPMGFSVLSSPVLSLCSRSSRFATLGRGGSGEFREVYFLCPLSFGSLSHCPLSHPLLLFWGGGGRENILLTLLLCTAVTLTIDLIYEFPVTVGRKFTCVLDGFSDLNYVGLGG